MAADAQQPAPEPAATPRPASAALLGIGLALLMALVVALRVAGPSDLHEGDQPRTAAYAVDAATGDAWLLQREVHGRPATEPPMYAWVGGPLIDLLGRTDEWVLKLPSLLAAGVTAIVVLALGWRFVGPAGAVVAAAVWVASPHTFKLAYTARPDALLAMFLAVALLSAVRQRDAWLAPTAFAAPGTGTAPGIPPGWPATLRRVAWIALFWFAVAGASLTQGLAALIPIAFLLGAIAYDGAWRRCLPAVQTAVAAAALGAAGWWGYLAMQAHPDLLDALVGEGTAAWEPWNAPLEFFARFLPWSLAFLAALPMAFRRRADGAYGYGWTLAWVLTVLAAFMAQPGARADEVFPAYAGAAVLVAALFVRAQERIGAYRVLAHLVLGGAGAAGLACSILVLVAPRPGPLVWLVGDVQPAWGAWYGPMVYTSAGLAAVAGLLTWVLIHRRRYLGGAVVAGYAVVGLLGFYNVTWDPAAAGRAGDYVAAVVEAAEEMSRASGAPIVVHDAADLPVPQRLGLRRVADEAALDALIPPAVLITSDAGLAAVAERFPTAEVVLHTQPLSRRTVDGLLLLRVE